MCWGWSLHILTSISNLAATYWNRGRWEGDWSAKGVSDGGSHGGTGTGASGSTDKYK